MTGLTSSALDVRRGAQRPRVAHFPETGSNAAEEFIDLAKVAGLCLDPAQCFVLRAGLGERRGGGWACPMCGCWKPRQNGKGGEAEALELGWLFLTKEPLIMHSAHEYKTAQEGFLRIRGLVENCPDLDRRVNRYWQANGEQGIELTKKHGGSRLRFIARSGTSGRGFTGTKNVADEAQELTGEQMAAVLPALSAVRDPQVWFFGTPPRTGAAWCYCLRQRGLDGDPSLVWLDWGADLDLEDPDDRARVGDVDLWYECNPALGLRITEEYVREVEFKALTLEAFAAERLGVWPKQLGAGGDAITEEAWSALFEPTSTVLADGARVFAIEVSHDRSEACIAVYGEGSSGVEHAELVDRRPGVTWVAARSAELDARWRPAAWVLDPHSPAATLLGELKELGIAPPERPEWAGHGSLILPSSGEVAAACGQLLDAVRERDFVHIGQPELARAAVGARRKDIGGGTGFDRRRSLGDVAPLYAVTLARWAYRWRRPEDGGPGCW